MDKEERLGIDHSDQHLHLSHLRSSITSSLLAPSLHALFTPAVSTLAPHAVLRPRTPPPSHSSSSSSSSSTANDTSAATISSRARRAAPAVPNAGLWSTIVLLLVILAQFVFSPLNSYSLQRLIPDFDSGLLGSLLRTSSSNHCTALPTGKQVCPNQPIFFEPLSVSRPSKMSLSAEAQKVAAEFEYSAAQVNAGVKEFIRQLDEGLGRNETEMAQIPTYVTAVPNGTEKGLYLAVDLGGTNFRVCSIQLNGDSTFNLTHTKVAIPRELMVAKTSKELFSFLAKQIEAFLQKHHDDHYRNHLRRRATVSNDEGYRDEEIFHLGFTFSFPVHQVGINKGTLIRWTKGFDIADTIGKDVCALLQDEIDALGLPVKVAALVNDTVGTLMARSYTSPGKTQTLLGAIFGTGTNGAYVEKLAKVHKMDAVHGDAEYDKSTGDMIINTEWGSFDNGLKVLPVTPYDDALDAESVNPGVQMFEKRISGMFLGEILRRALLALHRRMDVQLFRDDSSRAGSQHASTTTVIQDDSPLYEQWGLDTSFLSIVEADNSPGLRVTRQELDRALSVDAASVEDAEAVKLIAHAVGRRAARLAAVAIAGIVISTGRLRTDENVDIGVDGSLVEYYPGFEEHIRTALREVPEIGSSGEKRIRIGIAKDGSGVGAALIALVASNLDKNLGLEKANEHPLHARGHKRRESWWETVKNCRILISH